MGISGRIVSCGPHHRRTWAYVPGRQSGFQGAAAGRGAAHIDKVPPSSRYFGSPVARYTLTSPMMFEGLQPQWASSGGRGANTP